MGIPCFFAPTGDQCVVVWVLGQCVQTVGVLGAGVVVEFWFGILSHVHIAGTVLERSIFRGPPGDSRILWTY